MNWYKIATKSIQLPEEAYDQINEITSLVANFHVNNMYIPESPVKIYTIDFYNALYNTRMKSDIFINNNSMEATTHGGFLGEDNNIYLNPSLVYFKMSKTKNIVENIKQRYYPIILHEIDHLCYYFLKNKKDDASVFYEEKKSEFSAYSKTIISRLKNISQTEVGRLIVLDFLRTGKPIFLKNVVDGYSYNIIFYWSMKRKDLFHKLLLRIYNEVINENTDK